MSKVHQLFYLSRAAEGIDQPQIQQILSQARAKNWRLNVTGCLLFSGEHFAQVLEGDESTLRTLSSRIAADPRHRDFRMLLDREVENRLYRDWSMGFLYSMDLADRLEAALATAAPYADVQDLMSCIVADSLMGPL